MTIVSPCIDIVNPRSLLRDFVRKRNLRKCIIFL